MRFVLFCLIGTLFILASHVLGDIVLYVALGYVVGDLTDHVHDRWMR